MLRDGFVYRLMTDDQWKEAEDTAYLPYNADDIRGGFFHLSGPDQVMRTAQRFYAEHDRLLAIGIDPAILGPELKWEVAGDHGTFPHFYGKVPVSAVTQRLSMVQDPPGQFIVEGIVT